MFSFQVDGRYTKNSKYSPFFKSFFQLNGKGAQNQKAKKGFLTSRPQLNETVFGVSTRSEIYFRALKNKVLYD